MKNLSYSEIIEQIENAPLTWLGGILIACASAAKKKRFFRDDEALLRDSTTRLREASHRLWKDRFRRVGFGSDLK